MNKEWKVALRGGFSDRNGIKPVNTEIQVTSLDERSRTLLVNIFNEVISELRERCDCEELNLLCRDILIEVYQRIVDYSARCISLVISAVNSTIQNDEYDDVLTVLEYFIRKIQEAYPFGPLHPDVVTRFNNAFEKEYVGYRYVGGFIVPITNATESGSIEEALKSPYDNVNNHLQKAMGFLSDRVHPDYANSIKESISAVEAMCCNIVGEQKSLGEALNRLDEKGVVIHPALKIGFSKIYGYTSNANGIRHAAELGESDATFEEAKYMLVSCTAFVNYLIGVSSKQ